MRPFVFPEIVAVIHPLLLDELELTAKYRRRAVDLDPVPAAEDDFDASLRGAPRQHFVLCAHESTTQAAAIRADPTTFRSCGLEDHR